MSCRMAAAPPRDCVNYCGANCNCDLRHAAARDLIAFAAAGGPATLPRAGDWMQTRGGRQYWPLDPRACEVDIHDIAHALSKLCRYGGHTTEFYSVAEHSVLVARAQQCPPEYRLAALLHDAAEAYVTDIIRPIKPHLAGYSAIEAANMRAISERFALPTSAECIDAVKTLDNRILHDERDQAMATPPCDWNLPGFGLGVRLKFWSPREAAREFMTAFKQFGGVA